MTDWNRIRTEFMTGGTGCRELAEKYGLHVTTVAKRAKNERWRKTKEAHNRAQRLESLSDAAVDKIEQAMGELEKDFVKGELFDTGLVDLGRLRQIIQSIRDLRELLGETDPRGIDDASRLYEALERDEDEDTYQERGGRSNDAGEAFSKTKAADALGLCCGHPAAIPGGDL